MSARSAPGEPVPGRGVRLEPVEGRHAPGRGRRATVPLRLGGSVLLVIVSLPFWNADGATDAERRATMAIVGILLGAAFGLAPLPHPIRCAGGVAFGLMLIALAATAFAGPQAEIASRGAGGAGGSSAAATVIAVAMLLVGLGFVGGWTAAGLQWRRRTHVPTLRRLAASSPTFAHLARLLGVSPEQARWILRRHRIAPPSRRR